MKQSAGLLAYRIIGDAPEFFLVHPGGPFWKNKDAGSWSVPKGEFTPGESPLEAAVREFREETGFTALVQDYIELGPIKQKSGKWVYAFAFESDFAADEIKSNSFSIEWPPRSGRFADFPEVDRAGWFTAAQAAQKINPAQAKLILELEQRLKS